jgi:hypothetical protein
LAVASDRALTSAKVAANDVGPVTNRVKESLMTATTDIEPGLDLSAALASAPTTHQGILDFVREAAELCTPDRIHWCTGSEQEWTELTD